MLNGGVVAPGNSNRDTPCRSNVAFQPGSTYAVQINAGGASDLIQAGGAAAINGGAVQVSVGSGVVVGLNTIHHPHRRRGRHRSVQRDQRPSARTIRSSTPRSSTARTHLAHQHPQQRAARFRSRKTPTRPPSRAPRYHPGDRAAGERDRLAQRLDGAGGLHGAVGWDLSLRSDRAPGSVRLSARRRHRPPAPGGRRGRSAGGRTQDRRAHPRPSATVWTQPTELGRQRGRRRVADVSRSIGGFVTGIDNPLGDNARFGLAAGYSQSQFNRTPSRPQGQRQLRSRRLWRRQVRRARPARRRELHVARHLGEPLGRVPGLLGRPVVGLRRRHDAGLRRRGYGISTPYADLEPFASAAYVKPPHFEHERGRGRGGAARRVGHQDNTFTTLGLRAARASR